MVLIAMIVERSLSAQIEMLGGTIKEVIGNGFVLVDISGEQLPIMPSRNTRILAKFTMQDLPRAITWR